MFQSRSLGGRTPGRFVVILILFATTTLHGPKLLNAQTAFGTILGAVTDASQGAVPGATITITNTQTGIARQTITNQAGEYRVEPLLPGVYSVKSEHAGFQVIEVPGVIVAVARTATVNLVMQIGAVTQTVEVTAQAAQLETATATLGTSVDNATVVTLPLNGRNYTDMIELVPGSVSSGVFFGTTGGHNYNVSGMTYTQNSYLLDGMNANEEFFKQFGIQPSIDAIQEFKVQTNVTSAEYGFGAGANINVALKSGTNQLHGSAFEFLRNDKLDAVDWFTNATTVGVPHRPAYKQNQYGFVLGGPVYIPKVYNGRDKLFWLFNYEGEKIRSPNYSLDVIPTTAELGGNFQGAPPIYDPATTVQTGTDASGNPIYSRQQFSCNGQLNVICPNRLDSPMLHYAQLFYPPSTTNDIYNSNPTKVNTYQINTRADYKISDKLSFFARYSQATINQGSPESLPTYSLTQANLYKNAVASWTWVPSPTSVLNFKLGVNRSIILYIDDTPAPGGLAWEAANPMSGLSYASSRYPLLYYINPTDFTGIDQGGAPWPDTDLQGALSFTKIWGRNTFKMGFSIDNFRGMQANYGVNQFYYNSTPTDDPQNPSSTGYDMASFLLGLPYAVNRALGDSTIYGRWGQYDFYGQDDVRLTRRLTFNLGLRYGDDQLLRDRWDHLSQMNLTTQQWAWAGYNSVLGKGPNIQRTIDNPDYRQFAPRIGIAYQLNAKTTLRSGYAIFFATDALWDLQNIRGQWPYAISETIGNLNSIGCCGSPDTPIESIFPPNLSPTPGVVPTLFTNTSDIGNRSPYIQQYNVAVQRQLSSDLLLEVDYVGTKGTKMPMWWTPNQAPPGPGLVDPRRRWPQWSQFTDLSNSTSTDYSGLQVRMEKRFSHGVQFLATYAWGHTLGVAGASILDGSPMNSFNFHQDYGDENIDIRQIFTASYIYQLPFGRGQHFLPSANGIVNQLVGGWELTGITRFNSGGPYSVGINQDIANVGTTNQRPDTVPGVPKFISSSNEIDSGLNPAAFEMPAQYTWGTEGRNTFRTPGYGNWDIGMFKNFPLPGEKKMLEFRSEFFNAFNNVSMAGPNSTYCQPLPACNSQFGLASSTQSTPRVIQFALKLLF